MTPKNRSLLMRSNRLLGAQLVEQNLVKIEDLEVANEKLLELIGSGTNRQRTVLGILAYDLKALKEEDVLRHQAEQHGTGFADLRHYEINEELKASWDAEESWATWTVPFDSQEDMTFLATAYYLSPGVRKFWETRYDGKVLWYGTTLEGIADLLESMDKSTDETQTLAT
ncbi:MAG: hypothetical protein SynsKO_44400 [Synoicihabitans sp.]